MYLSRHLRGLSPNISLIFSFMLFACIDVSSILARNQLHLRSNWSSWRLIVVSTQLSLRPPKTLLHHSSSLKLIIVLISFFNLLIRLVPTRSTVSRFIISLISTRAFRQSVESLDVAEAFSASVSSLTFSEILLRFMSFTRCELVGFRYMFSVVRFSALLQCSLNSFDILYITPSSFILSSSLSLSGMYFLRSGMMVRSYSALMFFFTSFLLAGVNVGIPILLSSITE